MSGADGHADSLVQVSVYLPMQVTAHRAEKRLMKFVLTPVLIIAVLIAGCDEPTSPSPATSSLVYSVPAGAGHVAGSGNFTEVNASFGGDVRTTCVPDPNIAGSTCPDLMVLVRPFSDSLCQLFIYAPIGQQLTARSYLRAQRFPSAGVAGFNINCAKGGTACGWSVGQFTIHQLRSNANGVITKLHITYDQTCSNNDGTLYGAGTATGELWIVNGTKGFFDALRG